MRILIVDDHALVRDGIAGILQSQPGIEVVGQASDGLEAQVMARDLKPDIILMDITMPGTDGITATRLIKQAQREIRIVMLTVRDEDEKLFEAIKNGADGYLLKTIRAQELVEMLRAAYRGEPAITPVLGQRLLDEFRKALSTSVNATGEIDSMDTLTPREQQVLALAARGASDRAIATELVISLYTVKAHMRSILDKLHVKNRREATQHIHPR
jgi:DNA-binding NarL/FixJ family response regulator